jgi:transcriptional regulator with XRE-family HTH domain
MSFCGMQIDQIKNKEKHLIQLGERLKQLRKAKGFSNYEQFAYTYEIGRAQYGRYEKGANISFTTLLKILTIHGISLKEFFSEGFDE